MVPYTITAACFVVTMTASVEAIQDKLDINFATSPFISIWNAPSLKCEQRFGITLDLSYFDIVANTGDTFEGDAIVIYYRDKLGLYPWIADDGTFVNGGLPQLADLGAHLQQVISDVNKFIPNPAFSGLAVIDWEGWRPIFERNGYNDAMKVYIRASEAVVKKQHPDWSTAQIQIEAKNQFEKCARMFMQGTVHVCRTMRPSGFWGFYGFPDCYNHKPGQRNCSETTRAFNDQLWWLFNSSTSILPSVYLSERMCSHQDRYDKIYGGLQEAKRVREMYGDPYTPLVAYTRFRYGDTEAFYDMTDLDSSIRQAVDTGYNGVALWDSSASFESKDQCEAVKVYLDTKLGPFIKKTSISSRQCSINQCNGHGRCIRDLESSIYIWRKMRIALVQWFGLLCRLMYASAANLIYGQVDRECTYYACQSGSDHDVTWTQDIWHGHHIERDRSQCSCYPGWSGEWCDSKIE